MKRRPFLGICVNASILLVGATRVTPASAFTPPLISLVGVAIVVAVRRYAIAPLLASLELFLARVLGRPTELGRYLFAVAIEVFRYDRSAGAELAVAAEQEGAHQLARNGHPMTTELTITNNRDIPLELPRLRLLLVDERSGAVELTSAGSWGVVVEASATAKREIVASSFPHLGLKRWVIADNTRAYGKSDLFLVVGGA